jgi:hypothetical protein
MADCEYLDSCPVWANLNSDIKYVWIKHYCTGDKQERCERKQAYQQSGSAPENLLPNGSLLDD